MCALNRYRLARAASGEANAIRNATAAAANNPT
jgi:hypothetical protein